MGLSFLQKKNRTDAEFEGIHAVLPKDRKPWYRTWHLIQLNLILLVPLVSSSAVGYDASMMNGLQSLTQWKTYFGHPNSAILGTLNAVYPIGKVLMVFPVSWLGDRYGRRFPMIIGLCGMVAFAIFQAASQNVAMLIVSRYLIGSCTIMVAQPSPILITELAFPTHRGKLTALYNSSFYIGAIIAAWGTYGSFTLSSSWSWRIPSAIQGALPVLQLAFFWCLPESPRWLVSKGRIEEARAFFVKHHAGGDEASPIVDFEMQEIMQHMETGEEGATKVPWKEMLRTQANRRRTLIAVILGFYSQWSGTGLVTYYLTLVLDTIGITATKEQTLVNGILQIANFAGAVGVGALMIDWLGRRTLFLISAVGLFCSYVCWTVLSMEFHRTGNPSTAKGVLGFIFIACFFFNIAWTPMLYAYTVEIFPYKLRSFGLSTALMTANLALILGQFVHPIALADIGQRYYILFCCLLFVLIFLIYFLFPETKNRTLEEIAFIFEGEQNILGQKVAEEPAVMNEKEQVVTKKMEINV
ncbi:Major facilitator superfamily domain, general substrate transporter [Penicillium expansum]|uniref:Major facilitator superfamily domain, general substrate transporter n=1 Tax=Penicillium expansum TaxID=27334 RepID=A0A0A2IK56_PENEN|nr:Major facilitator superfamily domain, general substrate transporter [Penicillium expansum]KGO35900.1 Major facilitator superfamily domain, general substrate transporter [Penicillium expansum]KGO43492.1 Major facilitator superfamily domain, general substrate transporter [Penicillium expansum]KGO60576.1 Major facilitator superfamily domain, general substrate transporter [Penicillium expansum]